MRFLDWLKEHGACSEAVEWVESMPKQTPSYLWKNCPNGDWMLWVHEKAGTDFEVLVPVVYNCANRAMKHAGVDTVVIVDSVTAAEAAEAAELAWAEAVEAAESAWEEAVAWEARESAWSAKSKLAEAAAWSAAAAAGAAAGGAESKLAAEAEEVEEAAGAARAVEQKLIADECRELLPMPEWRGK